MKTCIFNHRHLKTSVFTRGLWIQCCSSVNNLSAELIDLKKKSVRYLTMDMQNKGLCNCLRWKYFAYLGKMCLHLSSFLTKMKNFHRLEKEYDGVKSGHMSWFESKKGKWEVVLLRVCKYGVFKWGLFRGSNKTLGTGKFPSWIYFICIVLTCRH